MDKTTARAKAYWHNPPYVQDRAGVSSLQNELGKTSERKKGRLPITVNEMGVNKGIGASTAQALLQNG